MNCKHLVLIAFLIAVYISYVIANTIVKVTENFNGSFIRNQIYSDLPFGEIHGTFPLSKYILREGTVSYISKNYIDANII